MYSAPCEEGVLYWTQVPRGAMTACPACTSSWPSVVVTRSIPKRTTVYSSNSGVCPGSIHPDGLRIRATLTAASFVVTRPTNSSIRFGLFPAASMTRGASICLTFMTPLCFADATLDFDSGRPHFACAFRAGRPRRRLQDAAEGNRGGGRRSSAAARHPVAGRQVVVAGTGAAAADDLRSFAAGAEARRRAIQSDDARSVAADLRRRVQAGARRRRSIARGDRVAGLATNELGNVVARFFKGRIHTLNARRRGAVGHRCQHGGSTSRFVPGAESIAAAARVRMDAG